jgi:hypothetical protein
MYIESNSVSRQKTFSTISSHQKKFFYMLVLIAFQQSSIPKPVAKKVK